MIANEGFGFRDGTGPAEESKRTNSFFTQDLPPHMAACYS